MSFEELSAWERDQVARARSTSCRAAMSRCSIARGRRCRRRCRGRKRRTHLESIWFSAVAPAWPHFEDVLTRYAAAKAFASWSLYLGDGVEAAADDRAHRAAVLRIECARQCRAFGRPLDRELLSNAIEQSDLLLVHYADPEKLATSPSTDRPRD